MIKLTKEKQIELDKIFKTLHKEYAFIKAHETGTCPYEGLEESLIKELKQRDKDIRKFLKACQKDDSICIKKMLEDGYFPENRDMVTWCVVFCSLNTMKVFLERGERFGRCELFNAYRVAKNREHKKIIEYLEENYSSEIEKFSNVYNLKPKK